jgi:tetratricopeptide (TPR) repeat protein
MTHDLQDQPLTARAAALKDVDDDAAHDEAIRLLVAATAAGEREAPGLLATCLVERGKHAEAREVLQRAVVGAGRSDLALFLADEVAELGEADLAESSYRTAIADDDPQALNNFGVFLRNQDRLDEAAAMLQRAIDAGDDYAPAALVALYAVNREDVETARDLGERYLDEAKPKTLLALADVYGMLGRHDEQLKLLERAVALRAPRAHIERGSFLRDVREDVGGAEREFRAAQEADEAGWGYELGSLLWETDRIPDAIRVLSHAAYWGDGDARELLQEIADELGDDWPDFDETTDDASLA